MNRLVVDVAPGEYTVTRLDPGTGVPAELLTRDGLVSVTATATEVSVVTPSEHAPDGGRTEPGWRLLTVRGPLEFTLTGIMAALAGALAQAGVPLFALSTFDTDHLLVRAVDLDRAVRALREAGHEIG
ncbi:MULTISPECIES: ACT domain-containing protein [Actinokineospora]|uniref:Amino acid-binding protein n=1 Tax=Actinokineospora fastidiosa TaxID=1816 RepID=A0A918GJ72_9PSEU|nr:MULTISPECIES: ACT domain-containing protein [Actinokineospora]UVS81005.1 hypothetical protein Actkin_04757 [Actinokineospora sp. UTMC 2448]GGS38881.1 amino acid-binding protein [Actinokineospora fastidiosa]